MNFKFNDGGRTQAGYKGSTGDCVTRAIAIVTGKTYSEVYDRMFIEIKKFAATKRSAAAKRAARGGGRAGTTPRNGISKKVYHKYLIEEIGMIWTPTMLVGQGCKVHLTEPELPSGKLIVQIARHLTIVIDGVINDTWNGSGKCVYGYYSFPSIPKKFAIGDEVIYKGIETQIIASIPGLNKYLVAGFGEQVSPENLKFGQRIAPMQKLTIE
ncbi:MAG TPA: hypothetical protein VFI29_06420 [Hanamia sp.]|nr:hypothetical protein [Hanamia sp.]